MVNFVMTKHAVAKMADGTTISTPFWQIESGRPGHGLVLLAAQHGNEVQGTEVALRFRDICVAELTAGRVFLVPFTNLPAIRHRRATSDIGPGQSKADTKNRNMQQVWPGNPEGNDIERIAYALDREVMSHCDRLVDMHCWEHHQAAAALAHADKPESVTMAKASGLRFVKWGESPNTSTKIVSSSALIYSRGGASLVVELSGQNQIREVQVQKGVRLMANVARALGMMEGDPELPDEPMVEVSTERDVEVAAPCSGMFVESGLSVEDRVTEGQSLGHMLRDDTLERQEITASVSGILFTYGRRGPQADVRFTGQHPFADEGDVLARIVEEA